MTSAGTKQLILCLSEIFQETPDLPDPSIRFFSKLQTCPVLIQDFQETPDLPDPSRRFLGNSRPAWYFQKIFRKLQTCLVLRLLFQSNLLENEIQFGDLSSIVGLQNGHLCTTRSLPIQLFATHYVKCLKKKKL